VIGVVLRNGSTTEVDASAAASLILGRAYYVHYYDALPAGDLSSLSILDLAFPAFLGAVPQFRRVLSPHGALRLQEVMDHASTCLANIPSEVRLSDWPDTPANRTSLVNLISATTGGAAGPLHGFGPACCTKMLHKKRPLLIPIVDNWQMSAWGKPTTWTPGRIVDVIFMIREHVSRQIDELELISRRVHEHDTTSPQLSAIRVYDILFWEMSRVLDEFGP
jgi:hypothetical protein